jgi:hypothetical protein
MNKSSCIQSRSRHMFYTSYVSYRCNFNLKCESSFERALCNGMHVLSYSGLCVRVSDHSIHKISVGSSSAQQSRFGATHFRIKPYINIDSPICDIRSVPSFFRVSSRPCVWSKICSLCHPLIMSSFNTFVCRFGTACNGSITDPLSGMYFSQDMISEYE